MNSQATLQRIEEALFGFNIQEHAAFKSMTEWRLSARNKQLTPEGDWRVWLILAGRGWGKTKTGAQDIAEYALTNEGVICGVVAPTAADVRDVCFDGPSGLR
ncbi:hypothetical protein, partial [Oenococcus oeni]|uniref:hypothetical protein n=1 Tax=Oenococcus oeni TaxID=1247 RepID=UPI001C5BD4D7